MSAFAAWKRTWRYIGWKHAAAALAAGALISLSVTVSILHINFYFAPWRFVYQLPWYTAFAAVFVVAVCVVESNAPQQRPTLANYVRAAVAASLVCLAGIVSLSDFMKMAPRRVVAIPVQPANYDAYRKQTALFATGLDGVVHCVIGLFVYVRLRNARLTAQALQRAQVRASEAASEALGARLQAVRERIDPSSLTQALEDIERLYWVDVSRAEASLDELIEFLRAAIPRVREEGTSVGAVDVVLQAAD